jgi:hypothetical protein
MAVRQAAARRAADNLGDLLKTTPALGALREGLPDAHLTLLTSPSGAGRRTALERFGIERFVADWLRALQEATR